MTEKNPPTLSLSDDKRSTHPYKAKNIPLLDTSYFAQYKEVNCVTF